MTLTHPKNTLYIFRSHRRFLDLEWCCQTQSIFPSEEAREIRHARTKCDGAIFLVKIRSSIFAVTVRSSAETRLVEQQHSTSARSSGRCAEDVLIGQLSSPRPHSAANVGTQRDTVSVEYTRCFQKNGPFLYHPTRRPLQASRLVFRRQRSPSGNGRLVQTFAEICTGGPVLRLHRKFECAVMPRWLALNAGSGAPAARKAIRHRLDGCLENFMDIGACLENPGAVLLYSQNGAQKMPKYAVPVFGPPAPVIM